MDKKLPRIFQNDINKEINNNRSVYYVKSESDDFSFSTRSEKNEKNFVEENNIEEKLNRIFKPGRHSFNVGVEIITTNQVYDTKIAGKVRDCIITLDNDVIAMKDIVDIKVK